MNEHSFSRDQTLKIQTHLILWRFFTHPVSHTYPFKNIIFTKCRVLSALDILASVTGLAEICFANGIEHIMCDSKWLCRWYRSSDALKWNVILCILNLNMINTHRRSHTHTHTHCQCCWNNQSWNVAATIRKHMRRMHAMKTIQWLMYSWILFSGLIL